jgi:hypothetical protein
MKNNPTNTSVINDLQYSLHNSDNFKIIIQNSSNDINKKYITLMNEYLLFIVENMKNMKKVKYFKYIVMRGLETITHVFSLILYYTKNLTLAYYHSQKSYYLFVEFIGQISEEQNTFLQLSSKDATMYVYKKTVYELHNDLKKNIIQKNEDIIKLESLDLNIQLLKMIINYIIYRDEFNKINISAITLLLEKIGNKIVLLNLKREKIDIYNKISFFLENISNNDVINYEKYLDLIDIFLKKIQKNIESINDIKGKMLSFEEKNDCKIIEFIQKNTADNFINLIVV